ncbi:MAG: rhodanese-like domain-containing protein [Candidatus Accumulibacter sp.]|nr:rhodanese-like domain-containing protein [Accumulibacter sp.]
MLAALAGGLLILPALSLDGVQAADAPSTQVKDGWYKTLVDFEFVRQNVDIPPRKGVAIIDSRPTARQFDPGHIPGAVNIPDTLFDKQASRLPADKSTLLIFYCGGVDCMLSHNSAFKAEKLGYPNIRVYAAGMPDWQARGGPLSVSAAYIKKLIDEKAPYALIDARPRRVAEKGMIPTAINISDTDFDKHIDKLPVDKTTRLIYYCGGLECLLSDKSAEKARKLGYVNVLTYPEGYPEWEKLHGAGPDAAPAAGSPALGVKTATLMAGKEKGTATVDSFVKVWKESPDSILLVDVRDAKEYIGGTIPGSINLPINDLEKKINTLPSDKPVVFICGTGARSGEAYDTVKLLRPDVQAYFLDADIKFNADGSYRITAKK